MLGLFKKKLKLSDIEKMILKKILNSYSKEYSNQIDNIKSIQIGKSDIPNFKSFKYDSLYLNQIYDPKLPTFILVGAYYNNSPIDLYVSEGVILGYSTLNKITLENIEKLKIETFFEKPWGEDLTSEIKEIFGRDFISKIDVSNSYKIDVNNSSYIVFKELNEYFLVGGLNGELFVVDKSSNLFTDSNLEVFLNMLNRNE